MSADVDDRDRTRVGIRYVGPGAVWRYSYMPGPAANSNGRNHSQLRIINDRDSAAVHVRHINLATVRRDGDASWVAPDGNVRDQSLRGSVDGRN